MNFLTNKKKEEFDPSNWKGLYPRIICNNGVTLSVQAGWGLYCSPRDNFGPYTHVEVGYLEKTEHPSEWQEYRDGPEGEVYAYVPIQLVVDFIKYNGGISQKTLELNQKKIYANLEWNEGEEECSS